MQWFGADNQYSANSATTDIALRSCRARYGLYHGSGTKYCVRQTRARPATRPNTRLSAGVRLAAEH